MMKLYCDEDVSNRLTEAVGSDAEVVGVGVVDN